MALGYNEWLAANPFPYDLQAYTAAGNDQFAGMLYDQRPLEWRLEAERMRRANAEHQAKFYSDTGTNASTEALLFNPFIRNQGGNWYTLDEQGNQTVQQIGQAPAPTDWYSEAAAGNPVIGASVTPGMSVANYNKLNPNAKTSVTAGSDLEKAVMNRGMLTGSGGGGGGVVSDRSVSGYGNGTYDPVATKEAIASVGGLEAWNRLSHEQRSVIIAAIKARTGGAPQGITSSINAQPGLLDANSRRSPAGGMLFGNGQ